MTLVFCFCPKHKFCSMTWNCTKLNNYKVKVKISFFNSIYGRPCCAIIIIFSVELLKLLLDLESGLEVVNLALVFTVFCSASLKFSLIQEHLKGLRLKLSFQLKILLNKVGELPRRTSVTEGSNSCIQDYSEEHTLNLILLENKIYIEYLFWCR